MGLIDLAERAVLPDWLIRFGMRRLMAERLRQEAAREAAEPGEPLRRFIEELRSSTIAIATDAANAQHYEFIQSHCRELGLNNVEVFTANVAELNTNAGECFSWPVPSFLAIGAESNGSSPTTSF